MDVEYGGDNVLNDEQKANIRAIMTHLAQAVALVKEPVDPKVEAALEIAFELCAEQLALDKHYKWLQDPPDEDRFLIDDGPSADDLESWFSDEN